MNHSPGNKDVQDFAQLPEIQKLQIAARDKADSKDGAPLTSSNIIFKNNTKNDLPQSKVQPDFEVEHADPHRVLPRVTTS